MADAARILTGRKLAKAACLPGNLELAGRIRFQQVIHAILSAVRKRTVVQI